MKPLHKTVKEAGSAINLSPWNHLTSNNLGVMATSSLPSFTSRTQPPRFLNKPPPMTMSSGGGPSFPGPINTAIPTIASTLSANLSANPYSTASLGSQGSGGYGTPVPATPLSAALGAAVQATVPNTPRIPSQPTNTLNVFERADRLLSQTSRRV